MKGKIKKVCLVCNKEFMVWNSHNYRKFCSKKCVGVYNSKNIIGENHPSWKGKIRKLCLSCNKEFEIYPYEKDSAKFCSRKCNDIYRSKNSIGNNNPNWKEKIVKMCLVCNKDFEVYLHRKDNAKFCSKKCMDIYRSGENSSLWKGGKSFEPYCPRFNNRKKEEIRNQYDRKCYLCGKDEKNNITKNGKIKKLSVHHLDMDKEQGCNGKGWKLVPLCIHCHGKIHKYKIKVI